MRRGWLGSVLLVVALIAVVAGRGSRAEHIAGAPTTITTGNAPVVGACVLWAPDPATGVSQFVDDDTTAQPVDNQIRSDNVAFGPCNGAVAGEVTTVVPGRPKAVDGSIGAVMGTWGDCWASAAQYVGLSDATRSARWFVGS